MRSRSTLARRLVSAVAVAALAFGISACGPEYDHTEISAQRYSVLGGEVSLRRLEVPEGLIVKARIVVWNDDDEAMPLVVRSSDPNILEVLPVVNDRTYAFVGRAVGTTTIELIADDARVVTIVATVTAQPSAD